jgi:hypothetical protein
MMKLTAGTVEAVLTDCLLTDEETREYGLVSTETRDLVDDIHAVVDLLVADGVLVKVQGILNNFVFNRERLEGHRQDVRDMLDALPDAFRQSMGGGWSFLNLCMDREDRQWTGLHRTQDFLCVLAIGLGLGVYAGPRQMWSAFPGGMPYFIYLDKEQQPQPTPEPQPEPQSAAGSES